MKTHSNSNTANVCSQHSKHILGNGYGSYLRPQDCPKLCCNGSSAPLFQLLLLDVYQFFIETPRKANEVGLVHLVVVVSRVISYMIPCRCLGMCIIIIYKQDRWMHIYSKYFTMYIILTWLGKMDSGYRKAIVTNYKFSYSCTKKLAYQPNQQTKCPQQKQKICPNHYSGEHVVIETSKHKKRKHQTLKFTEIINL